MADDQDMTPNKRILNAIDAAIEKSATENQLRYKIGNRELEKFSLTELINARKLYATRVAAEITDDEGNRTGGFQTVKVLY